MAKNYTITTKDIIERIRKNVQIKHESPENGLSLWLDYMIEFFDIKAYAYGQKKYEEHVRAMHAKNNLLFEATLAWMTIASKEIEIGGWDDVLGTVYEEMYQSKGKASSLGQFFTPKGLCDVMSDIAADKTMEKNGRIVDCACGSGRTLLSAFGKLHSGYYVGQDIDLMSVKMCALNMMIHNMEGVAAKTDTLNHPDTYDIAYVINEANHPFQCGCYSIRKVYMPEKEEVFKEPPKAEITKKVAEPTQLTFNFD